MPASLHTLLSQNQPQKPAGKPTAKSLAKGECKGQEEEFTMRHSLTKKGFISEPVNPGFPRKPSLAPPQLFSTDGRALPPVNWLFDLYVAYVLRAARGPGNQPNPELFNVFKLYVPVFGPQ